MAQLPLIAHFCHHKAGTIWFRNILSEVADRFGLKFQSCKQEDMEADIDIWLQNHSIVDFTYLRDYKATHMVRDPRDIIISGYFYHLWTDENWCREPRTEFGNKSYQERLRSLDESEGILFEIQRFAIFDAQYDRDVIANWNYENPNILEIRYEDLILNSERFVDIFRWYGFSDKQIERAMQIVKDNSFQKLSKRNLGQEKRNGHLRKGFPGDWKNYFTEKHKREFKRLCDDIEVKLGYEADRNW